MENSPGAMGMYSTRVLLPISSLLVMSAFDGPVISIFVSVRGRINDEKMGSKEMKRVK